MIQEMKAGLTKGQDVNDLAYDYYNEYPPYQKKFDILGMAEQRVLQIPVQMVDPINRNVVAMGSGIKVVAYNKRLIAANGSGYLGGLSKSPNSRTESSCLTSVLKMCLPSFPRGDWKKLWTLRAR